MQEKLQFTVPEGPPTESTHSLVSLPVGRGKGLRPRYPELFQIGACPGGTSHIKRTGLLAEIVKRTLKRYHCCFVGVAWSFSTLRDTYFFCSLDSTRCCQTGVELNAISDDFDRCLILYLRDYKLQGTAYYKRCQRRIY